MSPFGATYSDAMSDFRLEDRTYTRREMVDFKNRITLALGLTRSAVDQALEELRYRENTEFPEARDWATCAMTTGKGTACANGNLTDIGYGWSVCGTHHDALYRLLVRAVHHAPFRVVAEIAEALAKTRENDPHAREAIDEHLGRHFDRLVTERLNNKWAAA